MPHLTRTLALVAIVVAALMSAGGIVALAQSTPSAQRSAGGVRTTTPGPTPPPLPFGDQSRATHGSKRSTGVDGADDAASALARMPASMRSGMSRFTVYRGPRPPIPKLTDLLKHRARYRHSASGGSIVLTGTSLVPYLDDQTLSYGANVYWLCQNMKPSTTYRYVVFPPDGTAYTVSSRNYVGGGYSATFTTDASGRCMQLNGTANVPWYAQMSVQTPLAASPDPITGVGPTRAGAPDSPYSGVWTIAVQNTGTLAYEALAYSVVLGSLNFNTYSNAGLTTVASDFASGANVYVSASGLNPAHFYSFGFVNTSGNGLPCVYAIPAGSQNNANASCFVSGATGVLPTSQVLSGQYATPAAGANSVGTQTVQLYDATTNDLISTQQFSLNPSTIIWSPLIPYNGATNGTNLNDTFATDGLLGTPGGGASIVQEQSVQGLFYQASGVISGRVYRLTISNGNGVVLSSTTTDANPTFGSPQAFSAPFQFTAPSTSTGAQQLAFPINAANFTSFGATQTPFAPNVYTAQLYDTVTGTVVGSKSFRVVSYSGQFQWTNPAGSYVNALAAGAPTNVTTTLRNDAGVAYGIWNADSISAVTIRSDAGNFVSLGRQIGVTTTTDSVGQTWNITNPNAQTIVLTPAVGGQSLPPNGLLPIPITVAVAAGNCTTACTLQTQITPLHGVAASTYNATMLNRATNGLDVYGFGVVGANTRSSYTWSIGAFSTAALGTPRYNQAMYRSGTNAAPSSGFYTATVTVQNNGAPGTLYYLEFVMPATFDPNVQTPSIISATVNGVSQTANYTIYNQNGTNGAQADGNLGPNAFALVATAKAAGLPVGKSATFVLKLPVSLSAYPFQEIAATANYRDVKGYGSSAAYNVGPTNTLTNAVAGTQNIDSIELGVFSLDPALMYFSTSPAVVPALANSTWQFEFDNTTSGVDPNPDYVSQLLLTVPPAGGANYPTVTSVTASNGATFNANATGTPGQWLIDLCAVSTAPNAGTQASTPCAGTTDQNALPPGGKLFVNFKYTVAPAVGSYPVDWTIVGANGGAVVASTGPYASLRPNVVVMNTTAQTSFTYAGGYTATPSYPPGAPISSVPFGSQPIIGSWADYNKGNAYVYELYNNGSTVITDVSIAIPWANTSGQLFDTANPWVVDAATINVYGAGAAGPKCSGSGINSLVQAVNGTPGTSGLLKLSGCNLAVGQKLDVFLNMKNPYDVNSTFKFDASVATGNTTPPDPRVAANVDTLPIYSLSNTARIVADARLTISIPNGAGTYAPALYTAVPAVVCPGCTYNSAGAVPLINLNQINGTVTFTDALAASVYTDSANGWSLSVSADVNPGTSSGQLSTWLTPESAAPAGTYTKSITVAPGTVIPTAGTLALSTWSGTNPVPKKPVDNMMGYRVTLNPLAVNNNTVTTVTLTYTLIAN